jgi:hypothetical protein
LLSGAVLYTIAAALRRKQQNEMQRHMLDKFATAKDFAEFVQSPTGQKYLMSFSERPQACMEQSCDRYERAWCWCSGAPDWRRTKHAEKRELVPDAATDSDGGGNCRCGGVSGSVESEEMRRQAAIPFGAWIPVCAAFDGLPACFLQL